MDRARCATTPGNSPSSSDCPSRASSRSAFSWAARNQTRTTNMRRVPRKTLSLNASGTTPLDPTGGSRRTKQPSKTSGSPPACARSPGWSRCQSVSYAYMDGRQNLRQTVEERGFKLGQRAAAGTGDAAPNGRSGGNPKVRTRRYSNPNLLILRSRSGVRAGPPTRRPRSELADFAQLSPSTFSAD